MTTRPEAGPTTHPLLDPLERHIARARGHDFPLPLRGCATRQPQTLEARPTTDALIGPLQSHMSRARVHNFSISLDGFATGEPQTLEAPFGHAGQRLHEWMFATRFWDSDGGSDGVDNALAQRHGPGIG